LDLEKKIEDARRFFGIRQYPGNLFQLLGNSKELIEEHNLFLFKQDLDNLSGFIGYSSDYTIICINFNRSIGHQNFTLAHELGHMFLHNGVSKSDVDPEKSGSDQEELEANLFASELIYPRRFVEEDFEFIIENDLINPNLWGELADYIHSLCQKYFTSFKFTYHQLFKERLDRYQERERFYNELIKYIGRLSDRYPSYFYVPEPHHEFYQPSFEPYNYMKEIINELIDKQELGLETGEAIIERYGYLGGKL